MTQKETKPVLLKEKLNLCQKQSLIILSLHRPKRLNPPSFPFITFPYGVHGVVTLSLLSLEAPGPPPPPQLEVPHRHSCPLHPTPLSPTPWLQISQITSDPINSEARWL